LNGTNGTNGSNGTSLNDLGHSRSRQLQRFQRQITQKQRQIELYLHWRTNRKLYMVYRQAPFSMTLNDSYHRFQGHSIIWRWISQKQYEIQTWFQWNTNRDLGPTQQCHFEWPWVTYQNIQWHEASRGLSATAELLFFCPQNEMTFCVSCPTAVIM